MSDEEALDPREQKFFGLESRRKKINFVAAAAPAPDLVPPITPSTSAGNRYLDIVLPNAVSDEDSYFPPIDVSNRERKITDQQSNSRRAVCEVCDLPIDTLGNAISTASTNHESMIAHMVCLAHSHPPSHLDRNRQGFKYLLSYGWNPDRRKGLGATGEGIKVPIKAKVKNDTVGLGVKIKGIIKTTDVKLEKMDAKRLRKKSAEDRRKGERLQEMFYGNDDLEKYLG